MGLVLGGTVIGGGVAVLSSLIASIDEMIRVGVVIGVTAWVLASDVLGVVPRMPSPHRQVPQWVGQRPTGILQFGFELGTGVRTKSPTSLPHLVAAATVLLIAFPLQGILVGGMFGIGRWTALAMVVRSKDRVRTQDNLAALVESRVVMYSLTIGLVMVATSRVALHQ